MPRFFHQSLSLIFIFVLGFATNHEISVAQQADTQSNSSSATVQESDRTEQHSEKERFEKFSKLLTNAKLAGNFTIVGQKKKDLTPEEYHIKSVRKLDHGNQWMFTVRIKYQDKDVSIPLALDVQWAGDTPVVTLTDVAIPLMGTFSSRVVFYNDKYAGTWSHDDVGGHLFGTIMPDSAEGVEDKSDK